MAPGEFVHTFGDAHIYSNHQDAVNTQLDRSPDKRPSLHVNGSLFSVITELDPNSDKDMEGLIDFLDPSQFRMVGYKPLERIKAKLSTGLK